MGTIRSRAPRPRGERGHRHHHRPPDANLETIDLDGAMFDPIPPTPASSSRRPHRHRRPPYIRRSHRRSRTCLAWVDASTARRISGRREPEGGPSLQVVRWPIRARALRRRQSRFFFGGGSPERRLDVGHGGEQCDRMPSCKKTATSSLYDAAGRARWSTLTYNKGRILGLQNDGRLRWSSAAPSCGSN